MTAPLIKRFVIISSLCTALISFFIVTKVFEKNHKPAFDMMAAARQEGVVPLIILGSGPAGLTAGIYGARTPLQTIIIAGNKPGGALTETSYVENWPGYEKILGPELMEKLTNQAKSLGAEIIADTVQSVDFKQWPYVIKTETGKIFKALAVIIATGSTPRKLNIPGEEEYWGKGVTTCAKCDAPFHKGNEVVVVGGGDSAVEEALQLAPYAKKVTILVRGDDMRAVPSMQARLKDYDNIMVRYNTELKEIKGDGAQVTSIEVLNNKTNTKSPMPIKGVFLAIGHIPNTQLFNEFIEIDNQGYIITKNKNQHTSLEGIFAAGDVQDNYYKQAGKAAGDGIAAALDAAAFLREHGYTPSLSTEKPQLVIVEQKLPLEQLQSLEELEKKIKDEDRFVVLDFYTTYCPSCLHMMPALEIVAHRLRKEVVIYKVDSDKAKDLARKYHVISVPCLIILKQGFLVARYNQSMNQKQLYDLLTKLIEEKEMVEEEFEEVSR